MDITLESCHALSTCFLIFHWDPGLKPVGILQSALAVAGGDVTASSILILCLSLPCVHLCVHPYHAVLLRNSHS